MIRLLSFDTAKEDWFNKASELYAKKINAFYAFEKLSLKSPSKNDKTKVALESQTILKKTESNYLIICDERGKKLDSHAFSNMIVNLLESGHRNIDFAVGGAFGFDENVRDKAQQSICLAPFVMNHLVAQTVLMEQIYRSFCIWKGLPYHND